MTWAACSYAAALALAVALGAAAAAKFGHHGDTAAAFAALGLPAPRELAWAVPAAELGAALALVAVPVWGGAVALFLLVAFSAVLVDVVRRGAAVRCACFGAASSHDVAPADLVRNAGLVALAVAAVFSAGPVRPSAGAVGVVVGASLAWAALVAVTRRAR